MPRYGDQRRCTRKSPRSHSDHADPFSLADPAARTCSSPATRVSSAQGGLFGLPPPAQRASPSTPSALQSHYGLRNALRGGLVAARPAPYTPPDTLLAFL